MTPTRQADELPPGMLEYAAETAIADLKRRYGFDGMREIVAEIVNRQSGARPLRRAA